MKEHGLSAVELGCEGSALLCGGCSVQLIDDPRPTRVPQQSNHMPFEHLRNTCEVNTAPGSAVILDPPHKCELNHRIGP